MKCPKCGIVYNDSYTECPKCKESNPSNKEPNPSKVDLKKCPYCAELIKTEALKCWHCKSDLPVPELPDETPVEPIIKEPETLPEAPLVPKTHALAKPSGETLGDASKKAVVARSKIVYSWSKRAGRKIAEWWKNPKFRKGTYITAGVIALIIVAFIVVAVVTQQTPEEIAIGKAVDTVNEFIGYELEGDHTKALNKVDMNDSLLQVVMTIYGSDENNRPISVEDANALLSLDNNDFSKQMGSPNPTFQLLSGFTKSLKEKEPEYRKGFLIGDVCIVVVKNDENAKNGFIFFVPKDSSYINLSDMPTLLYGHVEGNNKMLSEAITNKVNEWLASPTKESCEASIKLIQLCDGLEEKYEFLLSDEYRKDMASTNMGLTEESKVEKAKELASNFPDLLAKAETELDNFKTVDDYITVTGPTEGQQYTVGQTATVNGTVKDKCALTLNGQAVGVGDTDKNFAPVVTVVEGANLLSLVVTNERGKTYNKDITIVGIPPAPPPPPTPPPASSNNALITLAEYNTLYENWDIGGTTYNEACSIIGGLPQEILGETGSPGGVGHSLTVVWHGDPAGSTWSTCQFYEGRLIMKDQNNLK